MYEITINGRTEHFDTAAEMEEFRQRMLSPKRTKFYKKKKGNNKQFKICKQGLSSFIKKDD